LNRLPEIKKFIYEDIPLFHDVEFKKVPGASPVLLFLNKDGNTVKEEDLSEWNRDDCNNALLSRGFHKRQSQSDEVPEAAKGPYLKQEL